MMLPVLMAFVLVAAGPPRAGDLDAQAARFREYRRELRESTWDTRPDLRRSDSPVPALMTELGHALEQQRMPVAKAKCLLGDPDETIRGGGRHNGELVPKRETHLIYWWRGGHDYLYLVVKDGRVIASRWWAAFE